MDDTIEKINAHIKKLLEIKRGLSRATFSKDNDGLYYLDLSKITDHELRDLFFSMYSRIQTENKHTRISFEEVLSDLIDTNISILTCMQECHTHNNVSDKESLMKKSITKLSDIHPLLPIAVPTVIIIIICIMLLPKEVQLALFNILGNFINNSKK